MKEWYKRWNKGHKKNVQVIYVSGDKDEKQFKKTMNANPWLGCPYEIDRAPIEEVIPCVGYPSIGAVNGKTGEVIDKDAYEKINQEGFDSWMEIVNAS